MQVFTITLNQMLVLFTFMSIGFIFNRTGLIPKETSKVLSKLETYLFLPCLTFKTFYQNCSLENFLKTGKFVLYGTGVMLISFLIAVLISRYFSKEDYTKKIYIYSFTIPNLGFMGNALVLGVFGETVLFQYMMFYISFQLFIYTYGVYALIPKSAGSKFSFKKLINPTLISLLLGAVFGILEIPLPAFVTTAVTSASACMSPVAMVIAGFVVGNYALKKLACNIKIYIASVIRLVAIPLFFFAVLKLLNVDQEIIKSAICATALPMGLNTIVFPEAYGGDSTTGASMALISHLISLITIPLIFAFLI